MGKWWKSSKTMIILSALQTETGVWYLHYSEETLSLRGLFFHLSFLFFAILTDFPVQNTSTFGPEQSSLPHSMPYNPDCYSDYADYNISLQSSINIFSNVQFPYAVTDCTNTSDKKWAQETKPSFCYPHPPPKRREGNHVLTSKKSVLAKTGDASTTDRTTPLPAQLRRRPVSLKMMWHEVTSD